MKNQDCWGVLLPRCQFCNQVPVLGVQGGFKVKRGFICMDCEGKIIQTEVDSPHYRYIVDKMKEMLK